jgi:serine/threonine protein kinase/tetratricopeptide (TPR) repeat protein
MFAKSWDGPMSNSQDFSGCPAPESWHGVIRGEHDEFGDHDIASHLEDCGSCAARFRFAAEEWSHQHGFDQPSLESLGPRAMSMLSHASQQWSRQETDKFRGSTELSEGSGRLGGRTFEDREPPSLPEYDNWQLIGRGGMGLVFRARQIDLNRQVAIKVLSSRGNFSSISRARAIREAMTMARLRHPHVVAVYSSGQSEGLPYLVMEWMEGGSLQDRLKQKGRFSCRDAAQVVRDVARAVAEAHAMGITHRDLKPSNILLTDRTTLVPKLADFGLSLVRDEASTLTETGVLIGTPSFMAPEQTGLLGIVEQPGPAADIHSLGSVLYAILTGHPPYRGESSWETLSRVARGEFEPLSKQRPDVPIDLRTIVQKCMEPNPSHRYRSAAALADDLDCFLNGRPVLARPLGLVERTLKWARRKPSQSVAAAMLLFLGIAAMFGTIYHIAEIKKANQVLATKEGEARHAKERAESLSKLLRHHFSSLASGQLERWMTKGAPLDESDQKYLREIQRIYLEIPLEPNASTKDFITRAADLDRLACIFTRIEQSNDAESAFRAGLKELDRAQPSLEALQLRRELLTGLINVFIKTHNHQKLLELTDDYKAIVGTEATSYLDLLLRYDALMARALSLDGLLRPVECERAYDEAELVVNALERTDALPSVVFNMRMLWKYNLGLALRNHGKVEQSLKLFQSLQADSESKKGESLPEQERALFITNAIERQIDTLIALGRVDECFPLQQKRDVVLNDQRQRLPDNIRASSDYLQNEILLCRILKIKNRLNEAEKSLRERIGIGTKFVSEHPTCYDATVNLSDLLVLLADIEIQHGRTREAIDAYNSVVDYLRPWTRRDVATLGYLRQNICHSFWEGALLSTNLGQHRVALDKLWIYLDYAIPGNRRPALLNIVGIACLSEADADLARAMKMLENDPEGLASAKKSIEEIRAAKKSRNKL